MSLLVLAADQIQHYQASFLDDLQTEFRILLNYTIGSKLENQPNPTKLHEDFIRKVDAWEAKKAWLEEHRTVDMSFIKKMNELSKAVFNLGKKLKKNVSNHAFLYPDIDLMRKKVWLGMVRIKKAIGISSLYQITSSTVSVLDIDEKAEANKTKDSSTKNNDVATIDNNAVEKRTSRSSMLPIL